MATKSKVKVDAEQLRGLLNAVTDIYSYSLFNPLVGRDGVSLKDDIQETIDVAAYLADVIWKKGVFHKDGQASVNSKDLEELLGCSKEIEEFCNRYLPDTAREQVGQFLADLKDCGANLKGV